MELETLVDGQLKDISVPFLCPKCGIIMNKSIWDYSKQAIYEYLLPTIDNCEYNLETDCSQ